MTRVKIATLLLGLMIIMGCNSHDKDNGKKTIFVTITPIQMLIDEITEGDFNVEVIVPKGASPETFEPSPKQITAMSDAEFIFSTGLIDFERNLTKRIDNGKGIINLSEGVEVMHGSCSHGHHHHAHGVDPHIWTSPRTLRQMVTNAHDAIIAKYPDSVKYTLATERLLARLDSLDCRCQRMLDAADVEAMIIYHPAYTYYARDYSIEQIAIEHDGKEPSLRQLTELINTAKQHNVDVVLRQPQYNIDKVRPIAEAIDAEIVTTDPLAEDIMAEIERVTAIISK